MPEAHSSWPASGFEAIMLCPGKRVLEQGLPDRTSSYAAEGTAAHQVLTWALQDDRPASAYIGRVIKTDGFTFDVTDDMARHVQVCLDYVHDVAGEHGVILVDRKVNYSRYLGVPETDAWGTLDVAVLMLDGEIIVIDFKYGMGVEVSAGEDVKLGAGSIVYVDAAYVNGDITAGVRKPNPQLALYGLGALAEFKEFGDFQRVRLVISQPRVTVKPSEYDLSVAELEQWAASEARQAVQVCQDAELRHEELAEYLRPNEKSCKFCRAKATCPALREEVHDTIYGRSDSTASPDEFAAETLVIEPNAFANEWLAACLGKVDLIEDWCKAVRAETERRMLAGETVPGFKLVEGKQGNRAWTDEKAVEALLKTMRLKQEEMYDFKLISPTSAEKLAPPKKLKKGEAAPKTPLGPRQWQQLQTHITRAPAKKHVAPLSDPRPALAVTPVVDEFDTVTAEPDFNDLA